MTCKKRNTQLSRPPWVTRKDRGLFPFFKTYGNAWYYRQWVAVNKQLYNQHIMTQQQFIDALPTAAHIWGHWETRTVFVNDVQLPPEPSQKVRNHSPDGFNWGYGGSGPAQFALALLMWYVGPETAQRYYQRFKFTWVGSLPQGDFDGVFDLRDIMRRKLAEEPDDPDLFTTKE